MLSVFPPLEMETSGSCPEVSTFVSDSFRAISFTHRTPENVMSNSIVGSKSGS